MNQTATSPTYTVQRDDTLSKIANRYATTWQVLKKLNNLADANKIHPGQVLKLPGTIDQDHPDLAKPTTSAGKPGPIRTQLPASGTGYTIYNPDLPPGSDRYGTAGFVQALQDLAAEWATISATPIAFGDMSRRDGPKFSPHAGHRSGREVDIRPLRKDGKNLPENWKNASYDRNLTRSLIELIRRREHNALVFFNDPVLIDAGLCKHLGGHDNHLHLQIYD